MMYIDDTEMRHQLCEEGKKNVYLMRCEERLGEERVGRASRVARGIEQSHHQGHLPSPSDEAGRRLQGRRIHHVVC